MNFAVLTLILLVVSLPGWAKAQQNTVRNNNVNKYLQETDFKAKLQEDYATVTAVPAHDGKLTIENQQRREVFIGDDFNAAPAFSERVGLDERAKPEVSNPTTEIYNRSFEDQQKRRMRANRREALVNHVLDSCSEKLARELYSKRGEAFVKRAVAACEAMVLIESTQALAEESKANPPSGK